MLGDRDAASLVFSREARIPAVPLEGVPPEGVQTDTQALAPQACARGRVLCSFAVGPRDSVFPSRRVCSIFYEIKQVKPVAFLGFGIKVK